MIQAFLLLLCSLNADATYVSSVNHGILATHPVEMFDPFHVLRGLEVDSYGELFIDYNRTVLGTYKLMLSTL